MDEITITSAKYAPNITRDGSDTSTIEAVINSVTYAVPNDLANRHYQAILDWVADGNTIQEAD